MQQENETFKELISQKVFEIDRLNKELQYMQSAITQKNKILHNYELSKAKLEDLEFKTTNDLIAFTDSVRNEITKDTKIKDFELKENILKNDTKM